MVDLFVWTDKDRIEEREKRLNYARSTFNWLAFFAPAALEYAIQHFIHFTSIR